MLEIAGGIILAVIVLANLDAILRLLAFLFCAGFVVGGIALILAWANS